MEDKLDIEELYEYASYLYNEASGEVKDIPTYEETNDWIIGINKRNYNKIYKMVKQAIENVYDNFYNGYIQLNDNHTLWEIDIPPCSEFEENKYFELVHEAANNFEAETGIEVFMDGRSGRHIVVENTFENAYEYDKLCEAQEKWEKWVINTFEELVKEK